MIWTRTATVRMTPVTQCMVTHENLTPNIGRNAVVIRHRILTAISQCSIRAKRLCRTSLSDGDTPDFSVTLKLSLEGLTTYKVHAGR